MSDPTQDHLRLLAQKYVDDGSVRDLDAGMRKARAIDRAAAIYLEAKTQLETERAIDAALARELAFDEDDDEDPIVSQHDYMTEDEVSDYLKIPVATLRDWRRKDSVKVLPFYRIGRLVRYRRSDLIATIAAGRVDPSGRS